MSPDLLEEGSVCLMILAGYLAVLLVVCLMADFVFPHIQFIERYLESLPEYDDDVELSRIEQERIGQKVESWKKSLTPKRRKF